MAIQVLAGAGGAATASAEAVLLAKQKAFVRKAQLAHQKVRAGAKTVLNPSRLHSLWKSSGHAFVMIREQVH